MTGSKAKQLETGDLASTGCSYKKKTPESDKRQVYYIGKFKHQAGRKFTLPELECLADEMLDYMDDEENIWLRSFFTGKERRISPKTIPKLCEQSEYFAYCYGIAMAIQEERLLNLGLQKANATAIFTLKAQHNWSENGNPEHQDKSTLELILDWPAEHETEEAKEKLKDKHIRDEMLRIVREEEASKRLTGGGQ